MINFILPNFFYNYKLNIKFYELSYSNPEYFNFKNLVFIGQEGQLPFCYWSGHNYNHSTASMWPKMQEFIDMKELSTSGLPLYFDCSNLLLLETDYYDCKLNNLIQFFSTGSNKLIVSDPNFCSYLSENFNFYHLIGSENYHLLDVEKKNLNSLERIKCNYNQLNEDYYKEIPKRQIEVNICSFCSNCSKEQQLECQRTLSQEVLMFSETTLLKECASGHPIILSTDQIIELNKKGYINFYIDNAAIGITDYEAFSQLYLDIFIKPEYKDLVRSML